MNRYRDDEYRQIERDAREQAEDDAPRGPLDGPGLVCECCYHAGLDVAWHDAGPDYPGQGSFLCRDYKACRARAGIFEPPADEDPGPPADDIPF